MLVIFLVSGGPSEQCIPTALAAGAEAVAFLDDNVAAIFPMSLYGWWAHKPHSEGFSQKRKEKSSILLRQNDIVCTSISQFYNLVYFIPSEMTFFIWGMLFLLL